MESPSCSILLIIIYVRPEDANEKRLTGFYRIHADVTEIHKALALKRIPTSS